ncbi:small subunit processome component 20 homolog [Sitophilus oryzae]|uniref:Small subunit processome component 20 homolog n=1 Tax=Sitophilus oryzae TaxID=7048 RepID=A0A6J2YIM9_SITOR|nr:small subunit processome component 20 homolog [Sitophilus oryzae]XP_030763252.1 small subunit processome component 20 homolog [Sitophilus oryzae]
MKNKSAKHKDTNTFKFQPFSERLSNINIDIFHKIRHEYESTTEEQECYFYQTVQKWNTLNLTEAYSQFKKEIRISNCILLPELLLEKHNVIYALIRHIKQGNPLCLQPLLEILVALVQDLQKEFYPYYSQFLDILIELLNTKDTEVLESIFTCLAYMFKYLWRHFIKHINNVFNSLLPLLSDDKPDYINSFAAESFAFVARKVKDKEAFLELLLNSVKKQSDSISGCGMLLFEVIKGVNDQFHSCAEQYLSFLLESLLNQRYSQDVLFKIIEHMFMNIAMKIHPTKIDLVWDILLKLLSNLEEQHKGDSCVDSELIVILKLLGQMVEYRGGKLLLKSTNVMHRLSALFDLSNINESVLLILIQISVSILLSPNIRLPQEEASLIIRKILCLDNKQLLLYFVDNISSSSSFEMLILPIFLRKCGVYQFDKEYCQILTKLLLRKAPLSFNGIHFSEWRKYIIDFKEFNELVFSKLKSSIDLQWEKDYTSYVSALICFQHLVVPINKRSMVMEILGKHLEVLLKSLETVDCENDTFQLIFLLNVLVETIAHMEFKVLIRKHFYMILSVLLRFSTDIKYLISLKTLSLLVTIFNDDEEIITMDVLNQIDAKCVVNFSSPYHEMRLYTAHIYKSFEALTYFDLKHSDDPEVPQEKWKVFSLIYEIESIEPSVHTYREQLNRLQKLNFDKPQMIMCSKTTFKLVPVRYMCGVLYINFKLLWEPVLKIIQSYAHGFVSNIFWSVFGLELKSAVNNIHNPLKNSMVSLESDLDVLRELYQQCQHLSTQPDFANYRRLLWKGLSLFSSVAESKTRDLSELFLNFIENEYNRNQNALGPVCNIKEFSDQEGEGYTNSEVVESVKENDDGDIHIKHFGKTGRHSVLTLLLEKLSVFSKFKSPKSAYREPELYQLYFDLLKHKNSTIQKAALDCIMTYKFKYLLPYKEHLYNLVDDKNLKHALVNFRVDKETTEIQKEHRENLIPVILQIVFSKMSAKTGLRTGGKASSQNRRIIILKYLAGCEEHEMLAFLKKAFFIYSSYIDEDEVKLVENVCNGVDLEKCLAPKKLLSTINLLNIILEQFGGLMGDQVLTYLLKILLVIGALVNGITINIQTAHSGYLSTLKTVRIAAITFLGSFFNKFEHYAWTDNQITAIFTCFVWPYLDKLNIDGIHSPTALLKLFKQWGSNPKYFMLLVKHKVDDPNQYILSHIIELLNNNKSHMSVVMTIYDIIENMLKYEEEEDEVRLKVSNIKSIEKSFFSKIGTNIKLNYGSSILLPHIPDILKKIKCKLESKSKNLNECELFILSRISELVWESEISDQVLTIILPIALKKSSADEHIILKLLDTILNLIRNVHNPEIHLPNLIPLFSEVSYASSRKVLIKILEQISEKCPDFTNTASLVSELNAFDVNWIDQPDFQRRQNAFKLIENQMDEDKIDMHLGTLLIHNCFNLMRNENDLALKDTSCHVLKCVCPYLIRKYESNYKSLDNILTNCLFMLIKKGMRSNNNNLRNECISLLGHVARECPTSHFILRDLSRFCNKDDLEVDIFENLTHLQIHRHARAMLKLSQIIQEQKIYPNPKTLGQFVLPLAWYYLCSDKFVGKNSIIDASIEMIGTVCKILPWHQYEGILKYSLSVLRNKAQYQKQLVRLVVVILDSFHFDLTKGYVDLNTEAETPTPIADENNENDLPLLDEQETDNTEEDTYIDDDVKIFGKNTVLCKSTATRVLKTIQTILLPQLHRSLAELTQYDHSHKVNRKKTSIEKEEEDLARVPISLAVVKLLQRLPKEILELNLPRVFLKLCTFLKSRLESVRKIARETLQKIMGTLGTKYLRMLIAEMAPLFNRGFQVHVLVFTVHGVLRSLKDAYEPHDIDEVLLTVVNLCTADLFGVLSEEKEIVKITVKVAEAKASKSYDTLQILAQYMTEKCLMDLVLPLKQIIEVNHSHKIIHKVQEALRYIVLGLIENKFISNESLLKFAYGLSAQKILELLPTKTPSKGDSKTKQVIEKEDCFIIPKIPGNRTMYRELNVKMSSNTNSYILVEFGLRLCLMLLKKERLRDNMYKPYIDPFIVIFRNCLKSKHVKLCTLTLQCLQWVMKDELPQMSQHIKSIASDMFSILHKYAASGLSKGDNFDLVVSAFKAMAVLVRDVKYYVIDTNQLKTLLLYVEQDMHNYERQATAFSLLKAIITRKLIVPEMHSVMSKVAELSITSEINYVRTQARLVFHQFIMEYPLGNSIDKHLGFYIAQLSFELQDGRVSAIEMIHTLINTFPLSVLKSHASTLLITLGARLVNDDVPECRRMIASCISSMLTRLPKSDRNPLFEMLCLWLKDKEMNHRRMAVQICGIFVNVEKGEFESRLSVMIPLILKQFGLTNQGAGKFVKLKKEKVLSDGVQKNRDHHYYQVLQLILKICEECPSFLKNKNEIELLGFHVQTLLGYPHEWVRLSSAQFLGYILSSMDIDHLSMLLLNNESEQGYLCGDPENYIKALTLDLCDQLQPGKVNSDLAEQVIKNLVFISRVLQKVPETSNKKINLLWLTKLMRKIINLEVIKDSSSIILRTEIFKWIAGIGAILDVVNIKSILNHLLAPLVREMITTEEKNAPLRQLSKEVARYLKNKVGVELYTKTLQSLQQNLEVKRAERKRARSQLAVTDPESYAQKRIKMHAKKKITKKRKLEELRGKKNFKRRKVVDLEDNSDVL